ncbi:MAG: hypothetical protein HDR04_06310 [Lachnospiraceae bacterium]|nr:hypothetical protein [Lachnospiraceae bacterium]
MDEMRKALEAYNTIREYCQNQKCINCLFSDESDLCFLFTGDVPENWQELDLD